jgi:amino acid adenylation domain-containing protein
MIRHLDNRRGNDVDDSRFDSQTCEFPLTYPQRGIWYLEKLNPLSGIGNLAATLKVDMVLDHALFEQALNHLLQKHEALRIRIRETADGQAVQYFAPYRPYRLESVDFVGKDRESIYQWDLEQVRKPYSSLDQDLYSFTYMRIDEKTSWVLFRLHHLITDAWSFVQIGNEVMICYEALAEGRELAAESTPSYRDFIFSEQQYIGSARYEADRAFWRSQYETMPQLTSLKQRPSERVSLGAKRRSFTLPDKLTAKIRDYCRQNRTSIFALFYAAMAIYINRIRNQDDITLGTPVLNRTNQREKNTIGMFISTVPLRIMVDHQQSFAQFSRLLDQTWFAVLKHQKYPYDCLFRDVHERFPEIERLYEIAISYQNNRLSTNECCIGREARWHFTECQAESLLLHINDREDDNEIVLNYDYQTDLFCAREIDFIHDHMARLLWHALDNPQRQIAMIHMLSEKEHQKVVRTFNETDTDYPREETLASLFAHVVDRNPTAVALEYGDERLTYGELDGMAESLARDLTVRGIGRESIVALMMYPSPTLLASILAVVKAGGAYLPIDPDYPKDRICYMLDHSGARIVLADPLTAVPPDYSGMILDAADFSAQARQAWRAGQRPARRACPARPEDLLYVIYTSGSTGQPKGVMIEHRNVVRLLFNDRNPFDFGSDDCWTLFHSACFDFSVWEMYGALLQGGRLVIVPKSTARDTLSFRRLLVRHQVTVLNQTPAAFYNLVDHELQASEHDLALRLVIFGGDALKPQLLRPFRNLYPHTRLVNMYGITETTVHVTYLELSDEDLQHRISNIGRPLPTLRVYILDSHLNPLPIGVPGEICVSGAGVGRGYLNNPDLTAERFLPNPFVPGEVLYRSGDLGRFFPRGDIEYLGRMDHQVKIRGHRIELGEIEAAILNFGQIREVRVMTCEQDEEQGNRQLIAYFVPENTRPEQPFDLKALRDSLTQTLPAYMVPAYLMALEGLPLTSNGKIARDRLPPPAATLEREPYAAPRTPLERLVATVFAEVLGRETIGLHDHFFRLGGDSLNAVRAIVALGETVSFADLYTHPTVQALASLIEQKSEQASPEPDDLRHLLPLGESPGVAACHLLLFPFGGGAAESYLTLASSLVEMSVSIEPVAVILPDERVRQSDLAMAIAAEIQAKLPGPLYFYGHCAGASLALETAQLLESAGRPIQALILGAILPPRHFVSPWQFLPDPAVLWILRRLGLSLPKDERNLARSLLQRFRSDAASFYQYFKHSHPILGCPIHCIVGEKDPLTTLANHHYRRWLDYSQSADLVVLPEAGHYFQKTHAHALAQIIYRKLGQEELVKSDRKSPGQEALLTSHDLAKTGITQPMMPALTGK